MPHSSQSHIHSWADEVEQSSDSTPDTVVPIWAASGRIRVRQPRFQPLVYPTPPQHRPPVSQPRYGPVIPPLMAVQQSFVPPPYDRPTSTDNYPCTDPSPRRRPRATRHETYPACSPRIQPGQSPARHGQGSSRGPQPSTSPGRVNPFAPPLPWTEFPLSRVYESPWNQHPPSNPRSRADKLHFHPSPTYSKAYS